MQVAASNPSFLSKEDITSDQTEKAKEVFLKEVVDKPKELQEKILQGKLDAYFKDQILLEQSFIKQPDVTVQNLIESATQKFGEKIALTKFMRFSTKD